MNNIENKIDITNDMLSLTSMLMLARYVKLQRVTVSHGRNTPMAKTVRRCHITSDIVRDDWKAQTNWRRLRKQRKPFN
jgi:hypothetical protein